MNKRFLFILMMFFSLILAGCQEKSTSRKSSSSNALNCSGNNYYTLPGCVGYCQYNPTSTSCTAGNNPSCSGQAYWQTPGCAGYCQYNPSAQACGGSGGTTGTTTGGSTTGGTTGTVNNCLVSPYSFQCYCQTFPMGTGCAGTGVGVLPSPGWGNKYHISPPDSSSSTCGTYNPSGVTQAYETRKGTITVGGGQWYNPAQPSNLVPSTNSSTLRTASAAKTFLITDSMLKIRFKVRPEPETQNTGDNICDRSDAPQSWLPGYHKLKFNVSLVGTRSNNTTTEEALGIITTSVNSCSNSIDLSNYAGMYPNGMYLKITNVMANKGCSSWNWQSGFSACNNWVTVRTSECWTTDIEVAADGTKTFD